MKRTSIACVVLLLCVASAEAQVRVSVKIEEPLMNAKYRPRTADAELAIATALARELPNYFSQWSYMPVPVDDGRVPDFTLAFRIYEHLGAHKFEMSLQAPAQQIKVWDKDWMRPGDHLLKGFPDRRVAGQVVSFQIARLLLNANQDEIFVEMKKVPLARTAKWLPVVGLREDPRLVLPLRWPGSRVLVNAMVRVECGDAKKLRSQALDSPAFYDESGSTRYEALVVKPLKRVVGDVETDVRTIRRQVLQMTPVAIYLEMMDPLGLQTPVSPR